MIRVSVHGEGELNAWSRRLAGATRVLRRREEAELRRVARPALAELRREIRGVPTSANKTWSPQTSRRGGPPPKGPLRSPIAHATQVRIEAAGDPQAEILIREEQVPPRVRWFVPYIAGVRKRWRHPFMGNRRLWVQHPGNVAVFWPTVKKYLPRFAQGMDRATEATSDYIERG